ncbi:hypothetical protein V1514DRAFT_287674 [Lipomyces japonicus]|uniref:uncharacterized protein n=1 Tax=Lipomyces japonicus TaxID=56871 RepID=UPI0034CD171D
MTDNADIDIDDILDDLDAQFNTEPVKNLPSGATAGRRASSSSLSSRRQARSSDLHKLEQAWISERTCPEILMFQTELIDLMMDRIHGQVEIIETESIMHGYDDDDDDHHHHHHVTTTSLSKKKFHDLNDGKNKFKLLLIETDLERIKFLIRGYVRARIHKIDKYYMHILQHENLITRLSSSERQYIKRYDHMLNKFYQSRILSSLPESLRSLTDKVAGMSMIEQPNLQSVVFVRVVQDVNVLDEPPGVVPPDMEDGLKKGQIYVLPYIHIRKLIEDGRAVFL